jgi:hypothetical protein
MDDISLILPQIGQEIDLKRMPMKECRSERKGMSEILSLKR